MDWIRRPGGEARRRLSIGEGLYLADGADDLEADGAGLELGPLGLLVPLRVTPLRVDLLLPAGHPSAAATLSVAGGLLLSLRRSDSDRRPPWPVEGESGFFLCFTSPNLRLEYPVSGQRMPRRHPPLRAVVGYWAHFPFQATHPGPSAQDGVQFLGPRSFVSVLGRS